MKIPDCVVRALTDEDDEDSGATTQQIRDGFIRWAKKMVQIL
jgi:hypothetical protein